MFDLCKKRRIITLFLNFLFIEISKPNSRVIVTETMSLIPAAEPKYKTISPYDLSSNDNPGAVISQPLLNGLNYDEWAINFRMAISSRKKFGFLDGSLPKPAADSTYLEDWTANNHLLVGWIKQTIEPKIRSSISTRENAKDLWDMIKKRYSLKSGARLQQLRNSLANCKQNGASIDDYFGRLTKIWDGIADCMNSKQCSCGKCECDLNSAREQEMETLRVHDFLSGLDDATHGVIRSQICAISPLPDLDSVYQTVSQNEIICSSTTTTTNTTVMGFSTQARPSNSSSNNFSKTNTSSRPGNKDPSRQCTACGRSGHEASGCFTIIGYPEWWEDRPKNRTSVRSKTNNQTKNVQPQANTATVTKAGQASKVQANVIITEADRLGLTGITDDQWRIVHKLINKGTATNEHLQGKNDECVWILDTGATHHMTGCLEIMEDTRDITPIPVLLPAGSEAMASKQGTIKLTNTLHIRNVYYVAGFHTNLISFGQLVTDNFLVGQVTDKLMILQDRTSRMLIGAGEREGEGLYRFRGIESLTSLQSTVRENSVLWHRRFGHPSSRITGIVSPLDTSSVAHDEYLIRSCDICFRAKQTRQSFPDSSHNAKDTFDLIHCDLWGPYRATTFCGSRYFLTILDDHSRALWLYLLPDKTRVSQQIREFMALVERQYSKKVKVLRSDNGTEFTCLANYFKDHGILHETSCAYTPQQNGRAERKHRHILNISRALRFQANLPIEFWGECVLTAAHLINRTPSPLLKNRTPFEILHGQPPEISHLRVLGCLAYAHNKNTKGDKFASRSRKCVLIGYPSGTKGWRLFDIEQEEVLISRDVTFQEDTFPYADKNSEQTPVDISPMTTPSPDEITGSEKDMMAQTSLDEVTSSVLPVTTETEHTETNQSHEQLGRGHRKKTPSSQYRDFVVNLVTAVSPLSPSLPSSFPHPSSGSCFPLSDYLSYDRISAKYCSYLIALATNIEPRSFKEAMKHKVWRDSMKSEIEALERQHTWDLQELPPTKKALGTKWVHTIKFHADGTIERHKSRLVVLGNNQKEGLDYTETFSPVAKMTTVRIFLDVAAKMKHEIHQMDVHNAFLHGDLHDEVYIKMPLGFSNPNDTRVCRLRKSLYGLKQAPRCWFAKLVDALLKYGFSQTHSDSSLFVYSRHNMSLRILVYVDDLIISGDSSQAINSFKAYLSTCFHMKDLGILKYFLGLEVARSSKGIYLCQRKYTLDIITECGLLGCRPAGSPMDQNHRLSKAQGDLLPDPERFRRLVGRLIYLLASRPDLAYSVHILSQFMQKPREEHWFAALKVVRYLKGTIGQGVLFRADTTFTVTGWCDADWGACSLSRRSLTGWIIQLGSSPITWKTKKQDAVALSSTEAEFRAMKAITKELIWIKELLLELGFDHKAPMLICCDNKSALHISANPVLHEQTKHMGIICAFVRDKIVKGVIRTTYVSTTDQLADIFTKALGRREFDDFLLKLGINNIHAPT